MYLPFLIFFLLGNNPPRVPALLLGLLLICLFLAYALQPPGLFIFLLVLPIMRLLELVVKHIINGTPRTKEDDITLHAHCDLQGASIEAYIVICKVNLIE